MNRRLLTTSLALGLLLVGCADDEPAIASTPASVPAPTTASSAGSAPIGSDDPTDVRQAAFEDVIADVGGGGVAAIRIGDGALTVHAAGTEPDDTPLDPDAVVRVGSISKTVTSVLVLSFVDEGRIDLDARLDAYLPDTPIGGDATVRQLLSHRSGIENYTEDPAFFAAVLRRPAASIDPTDVLNFADPQDAAFDPGDAFGYSNTNYVLLGQLLETVGEAPLNEILTERITDPFGLATMSFDLGDRTDVVGGQSAAIPSGDTATMSYTAVATSAWAAGSLVTNVDDLSTFLDAALSGKLLSAESTRLLQTIESPDDDYALGLHSGPDFGMGHGGAILGFNSIMQLDVATGDLLIVVVNNDLRSPEAVSGRVWDAVAGT